LQWSDIQFQPSRKTLQQFAGLWLACFGAMAVWEGIGRGHLARAAVLGALALTVGPVGLAWPMLVRPIFVTWMVLAFPIGWIISQAILALMYYGLFTPISLVFRLIGRDPLKRAYQPAVETYWAPKATASDPRRYFRQF
jgi:hypothetical protein